MFADTLHRFWKKEHDWGWKKFMELSKVLDGFVENDTLVIKAQVQVIRFLENSFSNSNNDVCLLRNKYLKLVFVTLSLLLSHP